MAKDFSYKDKSIGQTVIDQDVSKEILNQENLNRKLEADRSNLQQQIVRLEKDIYQLRQIIEKQNGSVYQVRSIGQTFDRKIIHLIYRLDSHKNMSNNSRTVYLKLPDKDAPTEEILELASSYDLNNFYKSKSKKALTPRHILFIIILQTYNLMREIAFLLATVVLKGLRKIRGRSNG